MAGGQLFGGLSFIPSGTSMLTLFIWIFIIIFFLSILGFGAYWLFLRITYHNKCVIFKKIGNTIMPISYDWARIIRISLDGTVWMRLRKTKRWTTRPEHQMGFVKSMFGMKPLFWFYEQKDGMLRNFRLTDIDAKLKEAGVHFVHDDLRLAQTEIGDLLFRKYKSTDIKKAMVMSIGAFIIFCVILTVMMIVLMNTGVKFMDKAASVTAQQAVAWDKMEEVFQTLDNILSNAKNVGIGLMLPIPLYFKRRRKKNECTRHSS